MHVCMRFVLSNAGRPAGENAGYMAGQGHSKRKDDLTCCYSETSAFLPHLNWDPLFVVPFSYLTVPALSVSHFTACFISPSLSRFSLSDYKHAWSTAVFLCIVTILQSLSWLDQIKFHMFCYSAGSHLLNPYHGRLRTETASSKLSIRTQEVGTYIV